MRFITTPLACHMLLGAFAHAGFAFDHYSVVPVVVSQDASFLRPLLLSSGSGIVRIGVFGDSQESCPDYWGRDYLMEANAQLVEAFGQASETVVLQQRGWDTSPNWLAATWHTVRPASLELPAAAAPPGLPAVARLGPADGVDSFRAVLMPNTERCPVDPRIGQPCFLDGPNIVADVLVARRSSAGWLRWEGALVASTHPTPEATPLVSGDLPGQPPNGHATGWVTTGLLPASTGSWRQVSILGADPVTPVDVIGVKFRNTDQPRGVVLQPLAFGGASMDELVGLHGASGPSIAALGLTAAILHYGANDGYVTADAWRQSLQGAIDMIRAAHGNPLFPIIIVSDSHRRELPPSTQYHLLPGAAAEVAMANPAVLALNMWRVHEERFLWTDAQNLGLADAVHLKPHAQRMLARATVSTMLEVAQIPVPGCAPGQAWWDRYYPLGASCAVGWPCTVLVEADAESIGRPYLAGLDCRDANSDGTPDVCLDAGSPDLNGDGIVNGGDLGILYTFWGTPDAGADLTHDGIVDGEDLGWLLIHWGPVG